MSERRKVNDDTEVDLSLFIGDKYYNLLKEDIGIWAEVMPVDKVLEVVGGTLVNLGTAMYVDGLARFDMSADEKDKHYKVHLDIYHKMAVVQWEIKKHGGIGNAAFETKCDYQNMSIDECVAFVKNEIAEIKTKK